MNQASLTSLYEKTLLTHCAPWERRSEDENAPWEDRVQRLDYMGGL